MPQRISATPLFATFRERGDLANFARKLNVAIPVVSNWRKRGIPPAMIRQVAHAMNLSSVDDYYRLAESGQKVSVRGPNGAKRNIPQSQAEIFLALVKTFLDTDAEGQLEIFEAATSLTESHDAHQTADRSRRKSRRR